MKSTTIAILAAASLDHSWIESQIAEAGVPAPKDDSDALQLAGKLCNLDSQRSVAAFAVNATNGNISSADLTTILKDECDTDSDRVGPHYLSLARSGKLKGVREDIEVSTGARGAKPFDSLEKATAAFDRVLRKVPTDDMDAFIIHARAALKDAKANV